MSWMRRHVGFGPQTDILRSGERSDDWLPRGETDRRLLRRRDVLLRFRRRPELLADCLKRYIKWWDHEDPDERGEDHASKHRRADVSTSQLRGAGRDHQRIEPEDEGEGRHHHRAEALSCTLGRRREQRHSRFSLLLRKLDDQDAVLGCQADQHDDADLRIKIERQLTEHDRGERSEDSDRDRKQTGTGIVQLS